MSTFNQNFVPYYISGTTVAQVSSHNGLLHSIVIGETAPGTITVYDEGVGTGTTTIVAVLKASIAEGTYLFDANISKGIRVVTAGGSKITVNYQ